MQNKLMGLGLFSLSIIHLVSIGEKESFETVEDHISDGNIVEYLYEKYKEHFMIYFDNRIYNNQQINAYFKSFSDWLILFTKSFQLFSPEPAAGA